MKAVIICFLLIPIFLGRDQIDFEKYFRSTVEIMRTMQFQIRPNIAGDSRSILVIVNRSSFAFNAEFTSDGIRFDTPPDSGNRNYRNPQIEVSPLLALVLTKKRDTSAFAFHKAESGLLHEITHYLQRTYAGMSSTGDMSEQARLPDEFEAYCVGGYYFLSQEAPDSLKQILASSYSDRKKQEAIVNASIRLIYPWRRVPFDLTS